MSKRKRRSSKGYYGYMPGRGSQNNNPVDEIYEEFHESEPKATEIMMFVLTREHADKCREKMGKDRRKIRWRVITIRVFV